MEKLTDYARRQVRYGDPPNDPDIRMASGLTASESIRPISARSAVRARVEEAENAGVVPDTVPSRSTTDELRRDLGLPEVD